MEFVLELIAKWIIIGIMVTITSICLKYLLALFEGYSELLLVSSTLSEKSKQEINQIIKDHKSEPRISLQEWIKEGLTNGFFLMFIIVWPLAIYIIAEHAYFQTKQIVSNLKELHRLRR